MCLYKGEQPTKRKRLDSKRLYAQLITVTLKHPLLLKMSFIDNLEKLVSSCFIFGEK